MRDNSLEYSWVTPGGTVAFTRSAGAATRLKDIAWSAQVRGETTDRQQSHGAIIDPSFKGRGTLSVTLDMVGTGATIEAARTALIKAANSTMRADSTVGWTNQGSAVPIKLSGVRLLEDPAFTIQGGRWKVMLLLQSPRPFAEDATATTVDSAVLSVGGGGFVVPITVPFTLTASSGGDLEVTHSGDFEYAYPVLRAFGPITNPVLANHTTGERLVFDGSIGAGDYWEVDLFWHTVLLNGVTRIRALDASQSTWWACAQGVNELQLSGSGYTSSTFLRALMKSSWG